MNLQRGKKIGMEKKEVGVKISKVHEQKALDVLEACESWKM